MIEDRVRPMTIRLGRDKRRPRGAVHRSSAAPAPNAPHNRSPRTQLARPSGRQDSNLRPLVPQTSPYFPIRVEFDLEGFRREMVGMTTRASANGIHWNRVDIHSRAIGRSPYRFFPIVLLPRTRPHGPDATTGAWDDRCRSVNSNRPSAAPRGGVARRI